MAAKKKPSIRNARKPRQPEPIEVEETAEEPTPTDLIVTYLHGIHAAMNAIAEQMKVLADVGLARNDLLEQNVETAATAEAPKRRGRRTNAEIAAAAKAAEVAAAAPEPAKPPAHEHKLEMLGRPGLARCVECNAVVDVDVPVETAAKPAVEVQKPATPPPAAKQTVEVQKPAAAVVTNNSGAVPTANDLRAVAISFAGVHGKPKLSEILKKYGCTNIAGVPEESRAALMLELSAEG
jgi:hypothetical protein